jgi:capsular exopolysaccharide synthesis family protein
VEANNNNRIDKVDISDLSESTTAPLNFKRVFSRAIQHWYLIVLSILVTLTAAYLYNRYTTRIYAVSASIIVREGTENAAAEFLYKSNPLVNPYRNFYNELYIMRSVPLLQEVIENLNFGVQWYRQGDIKTSEVYIPNFPIKINVLPGNVKPYGKSFAFTIVDENSFRLTRSGEEESQQPGGSDVHRFNDTIATDGFRFIATKSGQLTGATDNDYTVLFVNPTSLAKTYAARLRTTWAEQGSSVVNLDMSGPLPQKEVDFLTKFIERYQQYDVDKKNLVATKSIEFLDTQLATIGDSLTYFDKQIETFKGEHFLTDFESEAERAFEEISELETQKAKLILSDNYYKYLDNYIRTGRESDQIVPPSAVGITDEILTGLITQLTQLQFGLRMQGSQQSDRNPLVVEQRNKISQLKKDILEGMKSIKATQKINKDFIDKQIRTLETKVARLPQSERQMVDIRRSYSIRENLYLFLMQKRAEAGISRASTTSDIIVVNPPSQVGGPITPKPAQNYAIAMGLGLIIPFLFFIGSELMNDKVQSKEDIQQATSIPFIGGIGHSVNSETNLVVWSKPKSALAEAFRSLRSNLNYFTQGKEKKVIMITSSVSGEGKTFTSVNLATVMAMAGKRVVIIGADMRKPRIFDDFKLNNDKGLSTYLSSMATLKEVTQRTNIENLDMISAGPVPPNPSELLMSATVEVMFRELLQEYDYILLDTPPIGLVSDAFSLMPYAHHTIFMVRQNYTPKMFLKNIQELFERREIRNVSLLFNDIVKTGPGYGYGYSYGYGYGYGYGGSSKEGGYYSENER